MDLKGKVALIAGGARMGSAMAEAFGAKGCEVILTWRHSRRSTERTVAQLTARGKRAVALRCDLSQASSVQTLVRFLKKKWGRLDILVNMASAYETSSIRELASAQHWKNHWTVHVQESYVFAKVVMPLLRRPKTARIVLFSDWLSASGRPRYRDLTAYYVAKMGVKGLTEALALELAPSILVNAVAPGPILPPSDMSRREIRAVERVTPLRRWGGPEEVAKAAVFLCETDFMTGETIRVDGGRHLY